MHLQSIDALFTNRLIGGTFPPSKTILPVCNLRVMQVDSSILSFVFPGGIFEMAFSLDRGHHGRKGDT